LGALALLLAWHVMRLFSSLPPLLQAGTWSAPLQCFGIPGNVQSPVAAGHLAPLAEAAAAGRQLVVREISMEDLGERLGGGGARQPGRAWLGVVPGAKRAQGALGALGAARKLGGAWLCAVPAPGLETEIDRQARYLVECLAHQAGICLVPGGAGCHC